MSHDDIRAALEMSGEWCRWAVAGDPAYGCSCDYSTMSAADAHLVANAPEWLAELLAEVDALTARAEAAEAAVQRARDLSAALGREGRAMARLGGILRQGMADSAADAAARILRALDGGEQ